MPTKRFTFNKGGEERVEVSWTVLSEETTVTLDGAQILTIPTRAEVRKGRMVELSDGSRLEVKRLGSKLHVTRNGFPLPGSDSDPETLLKGTCSALFFITAWNLFQGLVLPLRDAEDIDLWSGAYGGVFALLGFLVWKKSAAALGVAVGLQAITVILLLFALKEEPPLVGMILLQLFLLGALTRGFGAIRELKEQDRQARMVDEF